ncbi:putative WD repeat-containing protein 34-like [Apostichopus japonicus]|uniref:Putative WD repeat-containing protein 34-like n=1 Tax=Stichopus japonicus TaxID=307972 RepID=A0A2G8KLK2_STIJA|nr:putative WD repeat-containing protein 34-like [Apostichopus japonicus]
MFTDESLDGVDFQSSWKKQRHLENSQTQTTEISYLDSSIQSTETLDQEVQTVAETAQEFRLADGDDKALAAFLRIVEPVVCKALERNIRSHAFDGYDVNWAEDTDVVKCVHILTEKSLDKSMQCTQLSWNRTGSTIAVSYGRLDHQDWCTHKGVLCTWNLDRRGINSSKADVAVDVPSCLMSIAFHPVKTAWIAGGSFNGQLSVWDLSQEDEPLLASSGIGDDSHREPITQIVWLQNPDKPSKYLLVSTSTDGRILIWEMKEGKRTIELKEGFLLLASSLPAGFMKGGRSRGDKEMGVNSVSYANDDPSLFLVGSDSGGIFKCSMNSRDPVPTSEVMPSVPLYSPVTFAFEPHNGPVHSVNCSPFHRNLFLACGIDTSARIYSMLEARHILSVEPGAGYLFSVQWSPVRPMVFAVTSGEGQLLIYDLQRSRNIPVHSLQASPEKKEVFCLEFNQSQKQLLATGDADGVITVWQLNDALTTQGAREAEALADIANSVLD